MNLNQLKNPVGAKIAQIRRWQTLHSSTLSLFLVISLWACQNHQNLENAIPDHALAVLSASEVPAHLPFQQVAWQQILLPLAKNQSGILYLGHSGDILAISSLQGVQVLPATQWHGIQFDHFRDAKGSTWTLAQLKSLVFLSTQAVLVEEATRKYTQGKKAHWVKALQSNTLQLNYRAVSNFQELNWERDAFPFESFTLQLKTPAGQQRGVGHLFSSMNPDEEDLRAALALVPASVNHFSPILPFLSQKVLLEPLRAKAGFSLHWGSGQQRQSALMLAFERPDLAQQALQNLSRDKGALPPVYYQTYHLQPILDLGLGLWPNRQATLVVQDRFLIITASVSLMERWIDALVVGNTLDKQLRQAPQGLWLRFDKNSALGLGLDYVQAAFGLDLKLPPVLHWEGQITQQNWNFKTAPLLEPTSGDAAQLWQFDLPLGTVRQLRSIEAWEGCLLESSANHLLLLDLEGNVRWDKKMDGPLVGPINSVYDPALQQTLLYFASSKAIHALRADGTELPAYPFTLNLGTTSGLSVGGREPFLFYASADGRIYGLDKTGTPLSGWNPGARVGTVKQALAFFQSANADYLLALNEEGELHVLDRAAQLHFPVQKLKGPLLSPPQWQWDQYGERIVVANALGKAQVYNAQGESFPLTLSRGTPGPVQLCFVDLIGDQRQDYLAAQGQHLYLHAYLEGKYQMVLHKEFKGKIAGLDAVKGRIVLSVPSLHEVWALSAKGEVLAGFPVAGDLFAGFERERLVVTGVGERVYGWAW